MNKEDILSVKERFGHLRRQATVSSSRSYDGLSVRERKLEKAKNLGVKLVPTFVAPSPPIHPIGGAAASDTSTNYSERGADRHRPVAQASSQQEEANGRDGESYYRSNVASGIPTPVRSGASSRTMNRNGDRSQRAGGGRSAAVRPSYSHNALSQASVRHDQEGREAESYYRSQVDTGSSVAAAVRSGTSQRQANQRVLDSATNKGEAGPPKAAAKPQKSSRLALFASRKKKVSADYEAIVANKEKEKTTSRFKFRLPFGKGRVKELMAKMEPQAETADPKRQPAPKPAKQSPSISPKHYFPPPKEPAPPPPREPAPPPPKGGSTVAPYHRETVSSRPSIESNIPTYRRGPVSNKPLVESSIPIPSYHRGANDIPPTESNIPSFYQRAPQSSKPTTESHAPSYHRTPKKSPSESNIPSYQRGPPTNKQYSPKHEDHPPSSKLPSPTPKTYYRQLLPRTPQATPTETAVVNNQMSLYKVQPYLVPIRTQPPPEVVYIPGPNEEERPPSETPKVSPPQSQPQQVGTSSNTATSQHVSTSEMPASSSINKSNMSLDSIIEEYVGMSPSPSATQPPSSELSNPSTKEDARLPSFVALPSSEPAAYRQLEPPSSQTGTSYQSSTYPNKPTYQSSRNKHNYQSSTFTTYTSKLPTPSVSGSKPTYQSSKRPTYSATKAPPVSSSSLSLDSVLTDLESAKKGSPSNSNSPAFRSQLPSEMSPPSRREDRSSPTKVASSSGPTSSLNSEAAAVGSSSMSLDSILDEFLKMSGTGNSGSGSSNNQTGATRKPQPSTKGEEEKSIKSTSSHQQFKEKDENGPITELQRRDDRANLESTPNHLQLNKKDGQNSKPSQEMRRESLLTQESTSTAHQRAKDNLKSGANAHPTIQSRQLQGRKEQTSLESAPTSRQLQSKDKSGQNSKPIPQARKQSHHEEQVSLQSTTNNRRLRVKISGNDSQPVSEPQQLQRRQELQSNPDLTSSIPTMSMSQNLVKLKARANSAGTILDEEPDYSDPKDARRPSNSSNQSGNSRASPTPKVRSCENAAHS